MSTYLGKGPSFLTAVSKVWIDHFWPLPVPTKGLLSIRPIRAELIFLLLTPSRAARILPRMLADIVGLIESEYVTERLRQAKAPEDVIEAIRAGQQVALELD